MKKYYPLFALGLFVLSAVSGYIASEIKSDFDIWLGFVSFISLIGCGVFFIGIFID